MDDIVPFASTAWFLQFSLLFFGRGMDFLSTWLATPHLVLEGNPIVKKLGWSWAVAFNGIVILLFSFSGFLTVTTVTMSLLVAARNFQGAWLMRLLGEEAYRDWQVEQVRHTPVGIYLFCLLGQTALVAFIGVALVWFNEPSAVSFAIGWGILFYVVAVGFYTLLAFWRIRRSSVG